MRDVVNQATGSALSGYLVVFTLEALMLLAAAVMLTRLDIQKFKKGVEEPSFAEKVALAAE
jgi:BCD family chlorophyll transporter-like MFS transporter